MDENFFVFLCQNPDSFFAKILILFSCKYFHMQEDCFHPLALFPLF